MVAPVTESVSPPVLDPNRAPQRLVVMVLAASGHFLRGKDVQTTRQSTAEQMEEIDDGVGPLGLSRALLGMGVSQNRTLPPLQRSTYVTAVNLLHHSVTQINTITPTALCAVLAARSVLGTNTAELTRESSGQIMNRAIELTIDRASGRRYAEALANTLIIPQGIRLSNPRVRSLACELSEMAGTFDGLHAAAGNLVDDPNCEMLLPNDRRLVNKTASSLLQTTAAGLV
jgi:hypothetical protein